jgi:hypothetical protein
MSANSTVTMRRSSVEIDIPPLGYGTGEAGFMRHDPAFTLPDGVFHAGRVGFDRRHLVSREIDL